jgi:hypothetical protein
MMDDELQKDLRIHCKRGRNETEVRDERERGLKKKGRFEQPTSKYFPKPLLIKRVGQKSNG